MIRSKRAEVAIDNDIVDKIKRIFGDNSMVNKDAQVWETEGGALTPEEEEVLRRVGRQLPQDTWPDINFFETDYE